MTTARPEPELVELVGRPARVGEVCECGRLALVVVGELPWCGEHDVIVGRRA